MTNFEFYLDEASEWRWRLKESTGTQLADSGEGYNHKSDCIKGSQLFITLGPSAGKRKVVEPSQVGRGTEWEYYADKQNRWRWRFQAGNNKIIADGTRGYATEKEVIDAIESVIKLLQSEGQNASSGNSYIPPVVGGASSGGRFA